MNDFENVKEGDAVVIKSLYDSSLEKVTKVTKTQIQVNNRKFKRKNGYEIGMDRWYTTKIEVPTEEEVVKICKKEIRKKLYDECCNVLRHASINYLKKIKDDFLKEGISCEIPINPIYEELYEKYKAL